LNQVIRAVVSVMSFTSIWLGASKPVKGRGQSRSRDQGQWMPEVNRQGAGQASRLVGEHLGTYWPLILFCLSEP
jgi:hypothetical protein